MKILCISPYITIDSIKSFSKNKTGFGYMVRDIAESIAKNEYVDLITFSSMNDSFVFNQVNILQHQWKCIIQNFKLKYLYHALIYLIEYRYPFNNIIRILYYFFSMGYIESLLKSHKYDIVHIHGCGPITEACIIACNICKVPYVITLHGLNSFSDSVDLTRAGKRYEKSFLIRSKRDNIPVTFISNGLISVVQSFLNSKNTKNHYVIVNGCDVKENSTILFQLKTEYNIPEDGKIMLFVGNISKRKNQLQLARAYNKLPQGLKETLYILYLGQYADYDDVVKYIKNHNLSDHLILCGVIPKYKVSNFYLQAHFTALLSISEGFGLSMIEGFVYGLPVLTFADLNAIPDLFDSKVMIAMKERSDEAVRDGIIELLERKWDREYIKKYACKFSLENMAEQYISTYRNVIDNYGH